MEDFTREELAVLLRKMRQDESYNKTCWDQNQKRSHQSSPDVKRRRAVLQNRIALTDSLVAKLQARLDACGPLPGLDN